MVDINLITPKITITEKIFEVTTILKLILVKLIIAEKNETHFITFSANVKDLKRFQSIKN